MDLCIVENSAWNIEKLLIVKINKPHEGTIVMFHQENVPFSKQLVLLENVSSEIRSNAANVVARSDHHRFLVSSMKEDSNENFIAYFLDKNWLLFHYLMKILMDEGGTWWTSMVCYLFFHYSTVSLPIFKAFFRFRSQLWL